MAAKIKKGDHIIVITGKDKGKNGEVISTFPKEKKIIVSGIHMLKHHERTKGQEPSRIFEKEGKIALSNVAMIDPIHKKATRIGFKILKNGQKVRFCKMSGEIMDKIRHDK